MQCNSFKREREREKKTGLKDTYYIMIHVSWTYDDYFSHLHRRDQLRIVLPV